MTPGFNPYFILVSNVLFPSCYSSLDITYLSKSLNRIETLGKRTYNEFRGRGINEAPGDPCRGHAWVYCTDGIP